MGAVHQQRRAQLARLQRLLHRHIARIEAPHEADLHQPPAKGGLAGDNRQAFGGARRERLFAQDGLGDAQAVEHQRCMGLVRRGDEHRSDRRVVDQRMGIGMAARHGKTLRDRRHARGVGVGHRDQFGPGHRACERCGVIGAHHARPDQAHSDGHAGSFPAGALARGYSSGSSSRSRHSWPLHALSSVRRVASASVRTGSAAGSMFSSWNGSLARSYSSCSPSL